jgi:hypothetical protein
LTRCAKERGHTNLKILVDDGYTGTNFDCPGVQEAFCVDQSWKNSAEDFYAWGEKAREKMAACSDGSLSLEEFSGWLKRS